MCGKTLAGARISFSALLLPEWRQRCVWQRLAAISKGVGERRCGSVTPHAAAAAFPHQGRREGVFQLVIRTETKIVQIQFADPRKSSNSPV